MKKAREIEVHLIYGDQDDDEWDVIAMPAVPRIGEFVYGLRHTHTKVSRVEWHFLDGVWTASVFLVEKDQDLASGPAA